jgi:hypothetical protein
MRIRVKTGTCLSLGFVLTFFLDYKRERPIGRLLAGPVNDFFYNPNGEIYIHDLGSPNNPHP